MAVRGEGRPLQACVIEHASAHTVHIIVFNFTMFTTTTLLCSSIKDCLNLEISRNNYTHIHQGKSCNFAAG